MFFPLFDLLPGVYFFAKNRQGELMLSGTRNLSMYHIHDPVDLIGLTDFDLNPAPMAKAYTKDDALIYSTGQPLLHRLELWFDEMGMPDWFLVSKLPVRARDGTIIGIMGFSQSYEKHVDFCRPWVPWPRPLTSYGAITRPTSPWRRWAARRDFRPANWSADSRRFSALARGSFLSRLASSPPARRWRPAATVPWPRSAWIADSAIKAPSLIISTTTWASPPDGSASCVPGANVAFHIT